jgi:hypothetical protein
MNSVQDDGTLLPPGIPIRAPSDQRLLGGSPRSFAACYALHRLLVPRHPPCALSSLTTIFFAKDRVRPATTGRFYSKDNLPQFHYSVAKERFTLKRRLASMLNLRPPVKGEISASLHRNSQALAPQSLAPSGLSSDSRPPRRTSNGGGDGIRTRGVLVANQVLYL